MGGSKATRRVAWNSQPAKGMACDGPPDLVVPACQFQASIPLSRALRLSAPPLRSDRLVQRSTPPGTDATSPANGHLARFRADVHSHWTIGVGKGPERDTRASAAASAGVLETGRGCGTRGPTATPVLAGTDAGRC